MEKAPQLFGDATHVNWWCGPSLGIGGPVGRWMKDIHEDGNTGHGPNLSARRENFVKDGDAPWELSLILS